MMGVDDPSRNFKGVHPVRPEKEERMRQLYKEMIALEKAGAEVAIDSIIEELNQTCLPTILRAQVEAGFELKVPVDLDVLWGSIATHCVSGPSYARFIRDHPYASTHYELLVHKAERTFPTWPDVRDGVNYTRFLHSRGLATSVFHNMMGSLCWTLLYTSDRPDYLAFIFPPSLPSVQTSLVHKIHASVAEWDLAGRPEGGRFLHQVIVGHECMSTDAVQFEGRGLRPALFSTVQNGAQDSLNRNTIGILSLRDV